MIHAVSKPEIEVGIVDGKVTLTTRMKIDEATIQLSAKMTPRQVEDLIAGLMTLAVDAKELEDEHGAKNE